MHGRIIDKGIDANQDYAWALFLEAVNEEGYAVIQRDYWPTTARTLDLDVEPELRMIWKGVETSFLHAKDGVAYVDLSGGEARVSVGAKDMRSAARMLARFREPLPPAISTEGKVNVTFWTYSPHGARSMSRQIEVPVWDAIADNYTKEVRGQLQSMMDENFRPAFGGQLALWHGDPGTGKTYALRALAWEWRDWADFHYVVDPERFFGEHSDYMLDVLVSGEELIASPGHGERDEEDEPNKWKVLLLEDTGELLTADAKERSGQALSRLLNVVDGIIGQGLRVLVLVTTNEEIKNLHPAVARPGRCAAQIEFEQLTEAEAREFLARHGMADRTPPGSRLLADLYAKVNGYDKQPSERSIGFAVV